MSQTRTVAKQRMSAFTGTRKGAFELIREKEKKSIERTKTRSGFPIPQVNSKKRRKAAVGVCTCPFTPWTRNERGTQKRTLGVVGGWVDETKKREKKKKKDTGKAEKVEDLKSWMRQTQARFGCSDFCVCSARWVRAFPLSSTSRYLCVCAVVRVEWHFCLKAG